MTSKHEPLLFLVDGCEMPVPKYPREMQQYKAEIYAQLLEHPDGLATLRRMREAWREHQAHENRLALLELAGAGMAEEPVRTECTNWLWHAEGKHRLSWSRVCSGCGAVRDD